MQKLIVNIEDSFVQDFLTIIEHYKDKVQVQKDENLVHDPYFYERKKELEKVIEESENGKMEMLSQKQYDEEMNAFFKDLKANENL